METGSTTLVVQHFGVGLEKGAFLALAHRLLTLVVALAEAGASLAANGIDPGNVGHVYIVTNLNLRCTNTS